MSFSREPVTVATRSVRRTGWSPDVHARRRDVRRHDGAEYFNGAAGRGDHVDDRALDDAAAVPDRRRQQPRVLDGTLDEVAVYDYALPAARIDAHHAAAARD